MAKSIEEIHRERARFNNISVNNELRKRLTQNIYINEIRKLESIESYIRQTKESFPYLYGGFALEPDVLTMLEDLRKECIKELRKKAAFERECYERRKAMGESQKDIEFLRINADEHTAKANSIQQTLDLIEAERRKIARQKAEEECRREEQVANQRRKWEQAKKLSRPVILIAICLFVVCIVLNKIVVQPIIEKRNIEIFKEEYESNLTQILGEHSLEYENIEYAELEPDYNLEHHKTERINEYEVCVYIDSDAPSAAKIFEIIADINWANHNYLLSNTYELLDSSEYVRDDTKEKGFHEVNTVLVFNDGCKYKKDYITLYKDGNEEWKKESTYTPPANKTDNAPAGECMYTDCDSNRAEGKYYCHIHKCNEIGCTSSTPPFISYCDAHNCIYPGCNGDKYKAVDSEYCKTHYAHLD